MASEGAKITLACLDCSNHFATTDEVWDPGDESKENSGYSDRCLVNLSLDEHHDVVLIGPL